MKAIDIDNYKFLKQLDVFLSGHHGFIAGGVFKNLFLHEPINDVDIFFCNETDRAQAVCHYEELVRKNICTFLYDNGKTSCYYHNELKVKIDLVKTIYGEPDTIINQFDFTITKAYYQKLSIAIDVNEWEYDYNIKVHDDFFEHLLAKRLVVDAQMPFPGSTFERILRYGKKGYQPCRETKIKLLEEIYKEVQRCYDLGSDIADLLTASLYAGHD